MNSQGSTLYRRISAYSASRQTLAIAFLWGLAEATVFFLVPDVLLGFVALFNWRRGLLSTVWVVAGAMVGGAIMYALAVNNVVAMNQLLTSIPLVNANMVNLVREQVGRSGLSALVTGPLQGIPYKIYAVQVGAQGLALIPFLLFTIPARLERILPVALVGAAVGVAFRKIIRRYPGLVVAGYVALWVCIYALYTVRFR